MPKNHQETLVWTTAAVSDIVRLREFIEPHNKKAAKIAADNLKKAALLLIDYPLIGKHVEDSNERELVISFGKRGYVMRYKIHGDAVVVLRIWHNLEEQ